MKKPGSFVMAGGGTGGHVIPALAVARELRNRGHSVRFIGTRRGMEAKLVPTENFPIEWIEIGGLKRVGLRKTASTLRELPLSVWQAARMLDRAQPAAVFSTGGFVAGPVLGYLKQYHGWDGLFCAAAGMCILSALTWLLIDCTRRLVPD